ncbi:type IV secretion system protein [Ralstonia chuxiongensis]|uniref:type IV secretion system protein n=1 Tax=Ralstonia chuxiongensis TaxID=2957504 RepID=UPI0028F61FE7|nr:type IV secretion system protein [Ralstonia chuxiongensis]CAJ0781450.1 hypothetical protein R8510_04875 [Ralstonia chuxiongensis]
MTMLRRGAASELAAPTGAPGKSKRVGARDMADWYYEKVRQAENSSMESERRLTRMAWRVAGGGMLVGLLGILGAGALVMLKRPDPPVIMRDNTVTGEVEILDVARSGKVTFGEAEDRADLRRYVAARESYDWETIQDMYDRVKATTCDKERDRYLNVYSGADAPHKVYKDQMRVIARANVISFVGETAQVFFEKRYVSLSSSLVAPKPEFGVATISYEHKDLPGKRSELEANPTGFCVTSYTTERDWTRNADAETGSVRAGANAAPAVPAPRGTNKGSGQ